jgi:UDP-N-acetyl-D-glucosamine dehydrogenase
MAYKADLKDYRGSPAIELYHLFERAGADVSFYDAWTPVIDEPGLTATSIELTDEALRDADLVVITTDHSDIDYRRVVNFAQAILDTRNATSGIECEKITLL